MSDENPRLKKWLEQTEQNKYQSDRNIKPTQYENKTVIYHVIQNESTSAVIYVGFWRRFIGKVLDWIILTVLILVLASIFGGSMNNSPNESGTYNGVQSLVVLVTWFLYYTILPSTNLKGTIGKLAIGAEIVNKDGYKLGYANSVGRFFAAFISWILFIGYIMIPSNPKKRALHDMMAGTYVVNKKQ